VQDVTLIYQGSTPHANVAGVGNPLAGAGSHIRGVRRINKTSGVTPGVAWGSLRTPLPCGCGTARRRQPTARS